MVDKRLAHWEVSNEGDIMFFELFFRSDTRKQEKLSQNSRFDFKIKHYDLHVENGLRPR